MKRKILVTTGTRAEYGILRSLLYEIVHNPKLQLILVVTGTHLSKKYGYTINEIKKDGFKINYKFSSIPKNDDNFSMSIQLGKSVVRFSEIFKKFKPDINILIGDRDEILASSLAASHMNIINAHIAGGDISGGLDEYNRHAITKLSNIHFPATKKSKQRILQMGETPKNVFHFGSLNIDEVKNNLIANKKILKEKYDLPLNGDEILLLQHSTTTETKHAKTQISTTLQALNKFNLPIIAISPNSDAGSKQISDYLLKYAQSHKNFRFFTTFPRSEFLCLLNNCKILVGNSSSGIIEASYFDIPIVNIGNRQLNREQGKNIFNVSKFDKNDIFNVISKAMKYKKSKNNFVYGHVNTAKKIAKILETIRLNDELIQKQITY